MKPTAVAADKASTFFAFLQRQAKKAATGVEAELLRRCALVSSFDESLYTGPLQQALTGKKKPPPFGTFVQRPEVARLPGQEGVYYIQESARRLLLASWASLTEPLRLFTRTLARYFQARRQPLDRFAQLIFADPPGAERLFRQLYKKADRAFDLNACDSLLRILRNRGTQRGRELTRLLNDYEQYFNSRSLFTDDWMRTAQFLERPGITFKVERFLAHPRRWLLVLHAPGGSGKSLYLRWLIARYCVPDRGPQSPPTPVARVDMDFLHLPAVSQAPWLLLVPVADQLQVQMGKAPFLNFLGVWKKVAAILQRPTTRDEKSGEPTPNLQGGAQCVRQFAESLDRAKVVVILDTTEELILHYPQAFTAILEQWKEIRAGCPGLKLIVAGRYDPFQRPETSAEVRALRSRANVVRVVPWTREECWRYLTEIRRLKPGLAFGSFRRPAGGNPFKLDLFANYSDPQKPFTRADLRSLRRVEITHLIERVIGRIPEHECALRWLLRYAVIPRQLTLDFVEKVLAEPLQAAMRSGDPLAPDRPSENLPEDAEILRHRPVWKPCDQSFVAAQQWPALRRYAGAASWIRLQDGQPRLQPEVLAPTRYLLQEQPIFSILHGRARAYFTALAGRPGHDWGEMMAEAVYHAFQLEGREATPYWLTLLQAPQAANTATRRKLLECVISSDFLDDAHRPLAHRLTGTIISLETLAQAYLELASLDVRDFLRDESPGKLSAAGQHFACFRDLERELAEPLPENGRRLLIEAAIKGEADPGGAVQFIDAVNAAAGSTVEPPYRVALMYLKGSLLSRNRQLGQAERCLREAALLAAGQAEPLIPRWRIQARLGRLAYERDDLVAAKDCYASVLDDPAALTLIPDRDLAELLRSAVTIQRLSAAWSAADALVRQFGPRLAQGHSRLVEELAASIQLDVYAPMGILRRDPPENSARLLCLRAQAEAMNGEFHQACSRLQHVQNMATAAAVQERANACWQELKILIQDIRDYRAAWSVPVTFENFAQYEIPAKLLLLEASHATHGAMRSLELWRELQKIAAESSPRVRALILGTGLALELESRETFGQLLDALADVHPAGARLPLLSPFRLFAGQPPVQNPFAARFLALLPPPRREAPDFPLHALLLADVLRFNGDAGSAAGLLKDALEKAASSVHLCRQIVCAMLRLEGFLGNNVLLAYLAQVDATAGRASELANIVRVELAEWWLKRQEYDLVRRELIDSPRPISQYSMRYALIRSDLSFVEANGDEIDGLEQRMDAAEMAAKLGIPRPARTDGAADASAPGQREGEPWHEHLLALSLRSSETLSIEFHPYGIRPLHAVYPLARTPLLRALRDDGFGDIQEAVSFRQQVEAEFMRILPAEVREVAYREHRLDCQLRLDGKGALAGIPWEWALPTTGVDSFRFVYRTSNERSIARERSAWLVNALIQARALPERSSASDPREIEEAERRIGVLLDGWSGPATRRALQRHVSARSAVLLKRSTESEQRLKTGYGMHSADLAMLYRRRDIGVEEREDVSESSDPMTSPGPRLLHIALPVVEDHGGLGFSSSRPLPSRALVSWLSAQGHPQRLQAFLILDVPPDACGPNNVRALLLRNRLAHFLFEQAPVRGVLACGLVPNYDEFGDTLVESIAGYEAAGETCRRLNTRFPDSPAMLYTWDPSLPIL